MAGNHKAHLTQALSLIDSDTRGLFIEELSEKIGEAVKKVKDKTAVVKTAVKLTTEEQKQIEFLIKKIWQRELVVDFRTDPKLIGGFLITVGDWKLDATLLNQLKRLKEILTV